MVRMMQTYTVLPEKVSSVVLRMVRMMQTYTVLPEVHAAAACSGHLNKFWGAKGRQF